MGPQHFVDTVAREHHLIASSFAALTPTNFRLRVDKNKLMGAFSLHTITEEEDIDTAPAQQLQLTSQDCSDDQAAPIVAEAKAENGVYRPTIWLEGSNNVIDDLPALFEMEKELFHQGSFTPSVFIQTEALSAYQDFSSTLFANHIYREKVNRKRCSAAGSLSPFSLTDLYRFRSALWTPVPDQRRGALQQSPKRGEGSSSSGGEGTARRAS